MRTGFELDFYDGDNPIFEAYRLYTAPWTDKYKNASFDLLAVHFAMLGEGEYYRLGARGRVEFYNEDPEKYEIDDATRFIDDPSGNLVIIEKICTDEALASELNRLMRGVSCENKNEGGR